MSLAAAIAVCTTLTACGAGASDATTIEVQTGMADGSAQYTALEEITARYEEANEGIEIRLVPSTASYEQDLRVRLAARDVPDVFNTHGWSRDRYSEFLAPLTDQPWTGDVSPTLDVAMRNADGDIFALPLTAGVSGIVYNADVLEAAGVDPAAITTWDDFTEASKKVVASGKVAIAAAAKDNWTAGNIADWVAPGLYEEAGLAALTEGEFVPAQYEPVLTIVRQWSDAGFFNPDYTSATSNDVSQYLARGDAAFAFQSNSLAQSVTTIAPDAKLGFIPVPSATGTPYLVGGEDYAFGVSKASTKADAAKAYLTYLAAPENLTVLAASMGNAAGLTTATSQLGIMQPSYDTYVTDEAVTVVPFFDRIYLPNGIWNTMVTTTDAMINRQSSPAEAAGQMKTSFDSLFGQQ